MSTIGDARAEGYAEGRKRGLLDAAAIIENGCRFATPHDATCDHLLIAEIFDLMAEGFDLEHALEQASAHNRERYVKRIAALAKAKAGG